MNGTIILRGGEKIENVISCDGLGSTQLKVNIFNKESRTVSVKDIFSIIF